MPLPRLGYLQPTPRILVEPIVRKLVPGGDRGWTAAGVDEFLRAYLTPAGRFAFYECARNVYRDEPYGEQGFWTRLKKLESRCPLRLGPTRTCSCRSRSCATSSVPCRGSAHLELDCGHVPQLERPEATHDAMAEFLA